MTLSANNFEHLFLGALALFVVLECVLTMLQTHAADRAARHLPEPFVGRLSEAAHRKAADYTGETAQAALLLTFLGAAFALLMTFGHGLTFLTALAMGLSSNMLVVQWTLLVLLLGAAALLEFPFGWFARFRVAERYGYMRRERGPWLARTARETLAGWLVALPLVAVLMALLEATGEYWWVAGWVLWVLYLVWRWGFSTAKGLFWGRRAKPVDDPALAALARDYLAALGIEMTDLCIMTRPRSWDHSHLVLAGFGRRRRVVLFAHAAARLSRGELLALLAHDVGHIRHGHAVLRVVLFSLVGALLFWAAGQLGDSPEFYAGFGLADVPLDRPGTHAGFMIACAIVAFPVLFYPLRPVVNLFSRLMQYDADRFAARVARPDDIVRALVRLHRDYATTLAPSRLYSLFHYRRPHAGMRIEAILTRAKAEGRPLDEARFPYGFSVLVSDLDRPVLERSALARALADERDEREEQEDTESRRTADEAADEALDEVVDEALDDRRYAVGLEEGNDPAGSEGNFRDSAAAARRTLRTLRRATNETASGEAVPDFLLRTPAKTPSVPAEKVEATEQADEEEREDDNTRETDKTQESDDARTKNDAALSQPGAKDS